MHHIPHTLLCVLLVDYAKDVPLEMIITNKRWRKVIEGDVYTERLKAFVIDEAHCVKNGKLNM